MSYTCPDFFDDVCDTMVRARVVTTDNLPEDEGGIAVMSERICAMFATPANPKKLTNAQEELLRKVYAYGALCNDGEIASRRVIMSREGHSYPEYYLKGGELTVMRTLVRDGYIEAVNTSGRATLHPEEVSGAYGRRLTENGRTVLARLILADARANFIEIAKLANREIA